MFRSKTDDGQLGLPFPQDSNDAFTNGGGLGTPTGIKMAPGSSYGSRRPRSSSAKA